MLSSSANPEKPVPAIKKNALSRFQKQSKATRSPTDNIMSPCTQKIEEKRVHAKPVNLKSTFESVQDE